MSITFNADVRTCSIGTAADTGALVITTTGRDISAGDRDIGSAGSVIGSTAADTGTITEAACQQLAGTTVIHFVLDGQGAVAVFVRFFNTGVF